MRELQPAVRAALPQRDADHLYGPNDNFHPQNAHVLPALMRRLHEARQEGRPSVTVWGTGRAMREFLHVDDMARASVFVMELDDAVYAANTRRTCRTSMSAPARIAPSASWPRPWRG